MRDDCSRGGKGNRHISVSDIYVKQAAHISDLEISQNMVPIKNILFF